MRKNAVVAFALVLAGLVQACISIPAVEIGGQNFSVATWDVRDYAGLPGDYPVDDITVGQFDAFMAAQYGESWTGLNLSQSEKEAAWEFVKHGYSAKKMTSEEYPAFFANAVATNANPATCNTYDAVAYNEGFAGYAFTSESNKTPLCAAEPRSLCTGGIVLPFINDLQAGGAPAPSQTPGEGDGIAEGLVGSGGREGSGIVGWFDSIKSYAIGAAVLVFAAFIVFSVVMRQGPATGQDAEMHRALSSETRIALLRELQQRDLTPTDLSTKVGKSKATVVEHLDKLMEAGFVEKKEEEGKKFVFYKLTGRGKDVLRKGG